jgi:hypothetical protein
MDQIQKQLAADKENGIDGSSGKHSTGWVRQPDGTMIKKSSSWSSWSSSSSSSGKIHPDDIDKLKNRIGEEHARLGGAPLDHEGHDIVPPNVEPGFEGRHKRRYD